MENNKYIEDHDSKSSKKKSLFSFFENRRFETLFEDGVPVQMFPYAFFLGLLGIIYIGTSHYYVGTERELKKLEREVNNLKADYTTGRAEYSNLSKLSNVIEKVAPLGLEESEKAPYKIVIKKGEY